MRGCGRRTHTLPDALATSIAAARSSRWSASSGPTSTTLPPLIPTAWSPSSCTRWLHKGKLGALGCKPKFCLACSWHSARPFWSGPSARLSDGLEGQRGTGVAGLPFPFSRSRDVPARGPCSFLGTWSSLSYMGVTSQEGHVPALVDQGTVHPRGHFEVSAFSRPPVRIGPYSVSGFVRNECPLSAGLHSEDRTWGYSQGPTCQ